MKKQTRGFYKLLVSDDEKTNVTVWYDNKTVLLGSNCVAKEPLVSLKQWNKSFTTFYSCKKCKYM